MADSRKTLGEFLEARTPGSGKDRISMNPDKGSDNILNEGDDLGIDPFTDGHLLNFDADDVSLLSDYLYFLVSEYQYIRGSEGSGQPSNSYRPANSTSEAVSAHKGDNLQNDHANAVAYAVDSDSTTFLEYSNSKNFDTDSYSLGDIVNKTAESLGPAFAESATEPSSESNHTLLSGIDGFDSSTSRNLDASGKTLLVSPAESSMDTNIDNTGNRAVIASREMLKASNRFAAGFSAFAKTNTASTSTVSRRQEGELIQRKFGYHDKEATADSGAGASEHVVGLESDTAAEGSSKLRDIGASLMIKSAGLDSHTEKPLDSLVPADLEASIGGKYDAPGMTEAAAFVASNENAAHGALPNLNASELYRARNASGAPTTPTGTGARDGRDEFLSKEDLSAIFYESFGTTYTPNITFEHSPRLLVAMAAAAIQIVRKYSKDLLDGAISTGLSDYGAGGSSAESSANRNQGSSGPYIKGESELSAYSTQALTIFVKMLLVPTTYSYSTCVDAGFKVLFGSSLTGNVGGVGEIDSSLIETMAADSSAGTSPSLGDSAGFWLAVARSMIVSSRTIAASLAKIGESYSDESFIGYVNVMRRSRILGMMNVMASIGDTSMRSKGGPVSDSDNGRVWDVDKLPDGPATRVMKSRSGGVNNSLSLAWAGNTLPSAYIIPTPTIMNAVKLGTLFTGGNPMRAAIGSSLADKVYFSNSSTSGDYAQFDYAQGGSRIPGDVVERLENMLEAEYVPFYFHDLRTNEIIAFHAFIESLNDSYSANYSTQKPYGRVDPVMIYKDTSRTIRMSFVAAATNKEDFDEMWWKINKLITLLYPQYTKGTLVETTHGDGSKSTFIQPFSQVIGGSPLIRLRVGDILKSNYSKPQLARLFGMGEDETSYLVPENAGFMGMGATTLGNMEIRRFMRDVCLKATVHAFYMLFGSPLQYIPQSLGGDTALGQVGMRAGRSLASKFLINGFANPLGLAVILNRMKDPDRIKKANPSHPGLVAGAGQDFLNMMGEIGGGYIGQEGIFADKVFVTPNPNGYEIADTGQRWIFNRHLNGTVRGRNPAHVMKQSTNKDLSPATTRTHYIVEITDHNAPDAIKGKRFKIQHKDLRPDPTSMFWPAGLLLSPVDALFALTDALANVGSQALGVPADTIIWAFQSPEGNFMSSFGAEGNPIVKGFDSTRGRGLAGVVTSMAFDWISDDVTWETDFGSRAPKLCKISMGFQPIHDISPGLDHSGFNRAPVYNVGNIMNEAIGDVYDDPFAAKASWKVEGRGTHLKSGDKDD
tara:strand:- start:30406 stop:34233 length:3828 start_codon:yes stop_codon:yes gene_type:complete